MFLTSAKLDWSIRRQEAVLMEGIPTAGPAHTQDITQISHATHVASTVEWSQIYITKVLMVLIWP